MRGAGRASRWVGRVAGLVGWLLACALAAHAGELSSAGGVVATGTVRASSGTWTLSGTVGQVVADSSGASAGTGRRLQ